MLKLFGVYKKRPGVARLSETFNRKGNGVVLSKGGRQII